MISGKNVRNALIVLTIIFTPDLVAKAYDMRGYSAIGGEFLLIPLILLVAELLKSSQTLWRESYGKRN